MKGFWERMAGMLQPLRRRVQPLPTQGGHIIDVDLGVTTGWLLDATPLVDRDPNTLTHNERRRRARMLRAAKGSAR